MPAVVEKTITALVALKNLGQKTSKQRTDMHGVSVLRHFAVQKERVFPNKWIMDKYTKLLVLITIIKYYFTNL
jgi:hypothetical protein